MSIMADLDPFAEVSDPVESQTSTESTAPDDSFSKLLEDIGFDNPDNPQSPSPSTSSVVEGAEGVPVSPGAADEPPESHWQSQYDRLQNEFNSFKEQAEGLNPLLRAVNQRPDVAMKVFEVIEQSFSGDKAQVNGVQAGEPAQEAAFAPSLKEPVEPTIPDDYDPSDAVSVPGTSSWKYREERDRFIQDSARYAVNYQKEFAAWQIQQNQLTQQELAAKQQLQTVYQTLVSEKKMQPAEAQQFMAWAQNPQWNLDQAVQAYRVLSGQATPGTPSQMPPQPLPRPASSATYPVPAAVAAGGSAGTGRSDADLIFDALVADQKGRDPFN